MAHIEYRAFVGGRPIRSTVAVAWTAFLNGRWTRERPAKPGKYVIANAAGRVTGEVFVFYDSELGDLAVRVRDSALCTIKELDESAIWWWSKPMPQLMPIAVPATARKSSAPAAKPRPKPVAPDTTEARERVRRYEDERRRTLMKQVGLHPMPKWEDER
jgi:hypothetical protein